MLEFDLSCVINSNKKIIKIFVHWINMKIHKFAVIILILLSLNSFALIENNDSIDHVFLGCNTCFGFTACRNCPFYAYFGCAYPYCSDSTNTWSTHRSFDFNNTYYSGCLITLKNNGIYDGCNSYAQAGVTFYLFDQNNDLITNISQGNTYSWDCDSYVQDNLISFYVSIYSDLSTTCNPSAYNVVNSFTPDINISYLSLPSELVCPDYYSDVYRYTPDAEKGQRLVLYDDCNISEYCDTEDPSCKPISADLGYSLSVEDSDPQARVFKQPGDYVTMVFHSNQTQTVEYSVIGLVSESETCVNGQAHLSVGETRCKFSIPEDATSALLTSGNKSANIHLTTNPDTIYVTDRNALKQRYTGDSNGVQQVLMQLYSKADEREGVVYYLDDYLTGRSWGDFDSYSEDPQNPDLTANAYVLSASSFTTNKCGKCKNTVLVGDDFVVPQTRRQVTLSATSYPFNILPRTEINAGIYSDFPYISRESIPFSRVSDTFKTSKVIIVLPRQDETTLAMYHSAQALSTELQYKYGLNNTYLLGGAEIMFSDNPYVLNCGSRDELKRATLILIGNEENNNAIACLPWNREPDTIAITRNTWSDQLDYAYVIDSDDYEVVDSFTQIIRDDLFSNTQISLISLVKFVSSDIPLPYSDMNLNFSDVPGVCGHFSDTYAHKDIDYLTGAWCTMNETRNVVIMLPVAPGFRYGNMPLKQEVSDFVIGTIWGSSGEDYYEDSLPYLAGNILHGFTTVGTALDLRYDYFERRDSGRSLMDAIGLIPAIGAIKKYDKVGKFLKNTGKADDAAKILIEMSTKEDKAEAAARVISYGDIPEGTKFIFAFNYYGKDAVALRGLLKSKGLTDAEVDQAFFKYIKAGYNFDKVKTAIEAKAAIQSMSEAEKISHLNQVFGGAVSKLKNDYGLADADILKISDKEIPLGEVLGKLERIKNDPAMGSVIARWTADAIRTDVVQVDEVSLLKTSEIISGLKKELNGKSPLSTDAGVDQVLKILDSPTSTFHAGDNVVDGVTVLKLGKDDYWDILKQEWRDGFGKKHVIFKHIDGNVNIVDTSLFPEGMTWDEVEEMIKVGLAKGTRDPNNPQQ
jgi:hypothetical protein